MSPDDFAFGDEVRMSVAGLGIVKGSVRSHHFGGKCVQTESVCYKIEDGALIELLPEPVKPETVKVTIEVPRVGGLHGQSLMDKIIDARAELEKANG